MVKAYETEPQITKNSTLDNLIDNLTYQLNRYSAITNSYENTTEKLLPSPSQPTSDEKECMLDPNGTLNALGRLIERFAKLNYENEDLISVFNDHI